MFKEEILKVAHSAEKKKKFCQESIAKYFVLSLIAGFYIMVGVALSYTASAIFNVDGKAYSKIAAGLTFSVALSLIYFAGAELFTGNCFVLTVGALEKRIKWIDWVKVIFVCYVGNFVGALLLGYLYAKSGVAKGLADNYIVHLAETKMHLSIEQAVLRGILCNFVVCAATWICYKMKDDVSKLILVFWCIFAFITAGFEHSIANMGILSLALMFPHPEAVTVSGMFYNLVWVTLGNIIGGAVFMAVPYWYACKSKSQKSNEAKHVA
ncbi:transporter [Clostridium polyendosporum]|uniref:Transporter n=1 Tax=Clostridium polyendosporum TaxID=69208 RepID=A0A919S138_9CLOT|nr:formate/nitrite transporter family protein [Clostridium polyendosporum]GIM29494.1 transporter [Clostridium polyendosporum]